MSAPITPQSIAMQCCVVLLSCVASDKLENVVACLRRSGHDKTVPTQLSLTAVCPYGRNILLYSMELSGLRQHVHTLCHVKARE